MVFIYLIWATIPRPSSFLIVLEARPSLLLFYKGIAPYHRVIIFDTIFDSYAKLVLNVNITKK